MYAIQKFHKQTGARRVFFCVEELANEGSEYQDAPLTSDPAFADESAKSYEASEALQKGRRKKRD